MVSVIIPTYNREQTIERAVKSVLDQTYQDFELIIVDDGSTDHTREKVDAFKSDKIRYIVQKNAGAAAARNTGIMQARGSVIAFQDSDDFWRPDKLEKQMKALEENDADIVFCKLLRHNYGNDNVWPTLPEGVVVYENILRIPCVSTQTLCGKADVFRENLFDSTLPALEDYAFSVKVARKYKMYHMKEVLVDLYLQKDSLTSNIEKYIEGNKRIITQYEDIWAEYPEIKAERLYVIGCLEAEAGRNDEEIFRESMQIKPSLKVIIKWLLAKVRLLSVISHKG